MLINPFIVLLGVLGIITKINLLIVIAGLLGIFIAIIGAYKGQLASGVGPLLFSYVIGFLLTKSLMGVFCVSIFWSAFNLVSLPLLMGLSNKNIKEEEGGTLSTKSGYKVLIVKTVKDISKALKTIREYDSSLSMTEAKEMLDNLPINLGKHDFIKAEEIKKFFEEKGFQVKLK